MKNNMVYAFVSSTGAYFESAGMQGLVNIVVARRMSGSLFRLIDGELVDDEILNFSFGVICDDDTEYHPENTVEEPCPSTARSPSFAAKDCPYLSVSVVA